MSAVAEPALDATVGRPPGPAQRAGAGGRAGARRRQQHRPGRDRRHRRHHARSRQGARDAADQHFRARHVDGHAADGLAGAPISAGAPRCRSAPCRGILTGLICCVAGAAGLVPAVQHRRDLQRLLCGGASVLPLRRHRHRERRVQAEGDLLGAGRRRLRRASSVRSSSSSPRTCGRPICSPRPISAQAALALVAGGVLMLLNIPQPPPRSATSEGRPLAEIAGSRASSSRSPAGSSAIR